MHAERYSNPQPTVDAIAATRRAGGRVVAVGTTSLRALEASAATGSLRAGSAETSLFITPGYRFRVVDRLLTNFHMPKSTLLMLVAAFGGLRRDAQRICACDPRALPIHELRRRDAPGARRGQRAPRRETPASRQAALRTGR